MEFTADGRGWRRHEAQYEGEVFFRPYGTRIVCLDGFTHR